MDDNTIVIYQTHDGKAQIDVIISAGCRVKSKRGTAFSIWARNILKDHLHCGEGEKDVMAKVVANQVNPKNQYCRGYEYRAVA